MIAVASSGGERLGASRPRNGQIILIIPCVTIAADGLKFQAQDTTLHPKINGEPAIGTLRFAVARTRHESYGILSYSERLWSRKLGLFLDLFLDLFVEDRDRATIDGLKRT